MKTMLEDVIEIKNEHRKRSEEINVLNKWKKRLNGLDLSYNFNEFQDEMERDGVVFIKGRSDDLVEIYGAIRDELDVEMKYYFVRGMFYLEEDLEESVSIWEIDLDEVFSIESFLGNDPFFEFMIPFNVKSEIVEIKYGGKLKSVYSESILIRYDDIKKFKWSERIK
ncbi:hypothetical protein [Peptostreptococcus faecalis]|uniref:hypothetical protein n=1 Tax=Peptostreptococcus faecalis TaxID=2045015 RepID=UPI000C7E41D0|nr:hypothetical protein [Peptostreptococcus faecalis]